MLYQTGPQPQEQAKRNRVHPVGGVQDRRLAVKRYIPTQTQLPGVILQQITHTTERVCADAVRWMQRRLRE